MYLEASGPLNAANSPWTKLVQGLVFGVALTVVVFAGAELSTGNMMTMLQGVLVHRRGAGIAAGVILGSFVGNLVGSVMFAWLIHSGGVLTAGGTPGHAAPATTLLAGVIKAKTAESAGALFFRAARTKSDGAKLALIFWCLLAFVSSGFEHVVANVTTFSLGLLEGVPAATLGAFGKNLLFVGLGNLVGGGLLVGAAYSLVGRRARMKAPAVEPAPAGV
ncbi:formate/nitrite transporter family protein [Amycolatopsis alkalitolerans]|uniref:formate/nitrite transporter family protein n=1 Tax=Amycolatopsis alkalitolerans TaxID=2547244 RepID=UPI00389947C0